MAKKSSQLPEWLAGMDSLLVETRETVQDLAERYPLIAEEFLPLIGKVQEMHSHLDQGMVSFHPEAKPEKDHYRAPDTKTCGQNKARGT